MKKYKKTNNNLVAQTTKAVEKEQTENCSCNCNGIKSMFNDLYLWDLYTAIAWFLLFMCVYFVSANPVALCGMLLTIFHSMFSKYNKNKEDTNSLLKTIEGKEEAKKHFFKFANTMTSIFGLARFICVLYLLFA